MKGHDHFILRDVYIMDHEVVPCQRAFFHGLISKICIFKVFGASRMWFVTQDSRHFIPSGCLYHGP